jgi:hypothetical protein
MKTNLDRIVQEFDFRSKQKAKAQHKVNMLDDLSSLANNTDEVAALQGGRPPVTNETLMNDRYVVIDANTGAVYRKLSRPNFSNFEIQKCKRMPNKKIRVMGSGKPPDRFKNDFRQKSRNIVKRTVDGARRVRGERQTRYRAFVIDREDGSCSELERMMDDICSISDTEAETGDAGDYVDMVREDGDLDGYFVGGIGGKDDSVEALTKTNFKGRDKKRNGRNGGMFDINFSVLGSDNKIESYRILLDSGATVNVVPAKFVEMLMLGCSENVKTRDCAPSNAKVASGASMQFEPYEASFEIKFSDEFWITINNAKVYNGDKNMIILGEPGLVENEVETRIKRSSNSKSLEVLVRGSKLREVWPNSSFVDLKDKAMLLAESPVNRAPTMHTHLFENSVVINERPTDVFDPNGTRAWSRKLERRHAEFEKSTRLTIV